MTVRNFRPAPASRSFSDSVNTSKLTDVTRTVFVLVGTVLTAYIGLATFGFISNSKVHYANFVLAIMLLSTIYGVEVLLGEHAKAGRLTFRLRFRIGLLALGAVLAIPGALYVRIHALRLDRIHPFFEQVDFYFGLVLLAGVLLLNWLHWGALLTSLVLITILYFFFGDRVTIPLLMLPEYDPHFVMNYLGLGLAEGMFWFARVAADNIYFLIIYASILLGVGMLKLVIEVGKVAGNHVRGGAAFPAIIGSGIVASVMGQAVANVVLTGRLTIPMMKERGFRPNMAGAIEAVASTSGQIMPPVLGLAGFIIAVFLNIPYLDVALAGLIPALLFLSGATIGVLSEALRAGLPTLNETIDGTVIVRLLPPFLISFGVVLWLLLGYYSPSYAGLFGIVAALTACAFQGRHRPTRAELLEAFTDGLRLITLLSLLLIAIGPLAQTFQTTNLAQRLGVLFSQIVPDSKLLILGGAMVISLLLGMGLPTPVAYLVVALSLTPFIQSAGVEPLVAHFFVFYFAVFSTLTPPVAVSALAAAKVSGGQFVGTAIDAMKLMLTTFIIPFAFAYHPQLLYFPRLGTDLIAPLLLVVFLQATTSAFCYGYLFVKLKQFDRWLALALTIAGLALLTGWARVELSIFIVLAAVFAARVLYMKRSAVR